MTDEKKVQAIRVALLDRKHDRITEEQFEQRVYDIVSPDWCPLAEPNVAPEWTETADEPDPSTLVEHKPEQPIALIPIQTDIEDK